ncbi:lipocalin-like domain-containing protein [Dyadobacter sp. CY345]|uniref:lipocalin-like domain-containing protein n=1 Tax=Dyadobacter sp. CY345 TaxID=2909335 RepID=UPI001F389133|nr:lipocalin-like domain-containing protein [Dyadobacter sp. CY345]MCF2445155.1 lipocalin-like domain-containing protein [Dyadobacter sp. CY345]
MRKLASIVLMIIFLWLSVSGCKKESCCNPENQDLEGTWQLEGYRDLKTNMLKEIPANDGRNVVYTFQDDGQEGMISGKTYSNTVGGSYEILGGSKLMVTNFGGSKVGEPEWSGKAWLRYGEYRYEIRDNWLSIYQETDSEKMIFRKK